MLTPIEEKSLKAQLSLANDIINCDRMIIKSINDFAYGTFAKVVNPIYINMRNAKNASEDKVEISISDLNEIKHALKTLSSYGELHGINSYIGENYLTPKEEKLNILKML